MFDVGFWELVILMLVALLIVGPEKLPKVARDAGKAVAKIRSFVAKIKLELEQDIDFDERRELQKGIDSVERLMQEAPDRLLADEGSNADIRTPPK